MTPIDPSSDDALHALLREALTESGFEVADLGALDEATSLIDDLGVDSFQLTRVARHVEEAFGLRFTLVDWVLEESEADSPYTVGSLFSFIRARLNDPAPTNG